MTRWLVLMVKEPRPGRVKTRLGQDIGMVAAAWWFRHQAARLVRRLDDPRWQLVLAVAPDAEGLVSRVWPAHLPRVAQGPGDLGDRMARVFRDLPPGPACIIGADIPRIQAGHIEQAFKALGDHDAALGPAPDGGYWLIGMKRSRSFPARGFEGVRWSTQHALEDTQASLPTLKFAHIARLRDVDTVHDL